jgi:hypothetical protein
MFLVGSVNVFADSCIIGGNMEVRLLYVKYDAHNNYLKVKLDGVYENTNVVLFVLGDYGITESDLRALESIALTALATGMPVKILLHDCVNKRGYSIFIMKPPLN